MKIKFKSRGDWTKTKEFLKMDPSKKFRSIIERYAQLGVQALTAATPVDTGKTADSWGYEIEYGDGKTTIWWTNSNVNDGFSIAILIQYGHGLADGTYVEGRDYINPAIRPIFDGIAKDIWKEVFK